MSESDKETPELESVHVHEVYDAIADHFSGTRHSVCSFFTILFSLSSLFSFKQTWPRAEKFIRDLPRYSLIGDIGCGNGKYISLAGPCCHEIIGCDRSSALVHLCREMKRPAFVSDGLSSGFRSDSLDAAISVAVIHHFSTPTRREMAIKELLRVVRPGGFVLVTAWAKEQPRFENETSQDVYVKWKYTKPRTAAKEEDPVYQRYYHLFIEGELESLCESVGGADIVERGNEAHNWYVVLRKH